MIDAIHSALTGIQAHLESFDRTAERIARTAPTGDLAGDLVQLMIDRHGVAAGGAVLRTADEMVGTLLDRLA